VPDELEIQLNAAVDAIVASRANKKIVVVGPGTGKTWLFKRLLEADGGKADDYLILTFINNLKNDLERDLADHARVYTFHGYCRRLLYRKPQLRIGLTEDFQYFPPLVSLIKVDWELACDGDAPEFVLLMRELNEGAETNFYLLRANYYNAVAFDDSVFRAYKGLETRAEDIDPYRLLLIDEYQDFNRLEAAFIGRLGTASPTVIAGDDDQALYSQLRSSSPQFIRDVYSGGEYQRFPLPFCMRCTAPIVGAVEDIIRSAKALGKLEGRIPKPYLFYPPKKGPDSDLYPRIKLVKTTVQSNHVNYFGRYIEQQILEIPPEDIQEAHEGHFPTVLIIGSSQYLRQIKDHLVRGGHPCQTGEGDDPMELRREVGLRFLQDHPDSNLGWRILLEIDEPAFGQDVLRKAIIEGPPIIELIPDQYREQTLSELNQLSQESHIEAGGDETVEEFVIRLTSFEGSKGLSAQHVFIVGLQAGDLPRNANNITDLEICKFLVALTRTRKQCHIIHTGRWSGEARRPSIFLQWIRRERFEPIEVNRAYWGKE
jgi:superfamily I DNA/RNA helicase